MFRNSAVSTARSSGGTRMHRLPHNYFLHIDKKTKFSKQLKLGAHYQNQLAWYHNAQASVHTKTFAIQRLYHSNPILSLSTNIKSTSFDTNNNKKYTTAPQNTSNNKTHHKFRHLNNKKNHLISRSHEILYNTPIGAMTNEQIAEAQSLIYQWANTINDTTGTGGRVTDTAYIMESLLDRLIEEHDDGFNENSLVVTTKDYNVVMNAYGRSVSQFFQKRQQMMLNNNNWKQNQNKLSFHNQESDEDKEHDSIAKIEALYQRMKERFDNFNDIYNEESNDRAELPKPDIITYNTILNAYSNQPKYEKGVQKAEEIIKLLESKDSNVNPDTWSYNALMNIYANQIGEYGYAQKAEDVLLNMSKMRKEGSDNVVPDTTSFNIVLKAWRNSGGGSIECELQSMILCHLLNVPDHVADLFVALVSCKKSRRYLTDYD